MLVPLALRCSGARHVAPLMLSPADLWASYEAAADSNSLLTDIWTSAIIHPVSDAAAQLTETQLRAKAPFDPVRNGRFLVYGAADGVLSHVWFEVLDGAVGTDGTLVQTLEKVAGDALVYTPLWCVWFLAAFAVLEGRPWRSIPSVISADWLELFRGNLGFFLPLTGKPNPNPTLTRTRTRTRTRTLTLTLTLTLGLIYGFVPIEERVLAFSAASLVYT